MYIITIIMIARGASVKQTKINKGGFYFKLGADLTAAKAPGVTIGPDLGLLISDKQETFGESSDFIFAYCLSKILYKRKTLQP